MSSPKHEKPLVTVLTGASSGLGEALAPLLARDGEIVILAARRLDSLDALARRIREDGLDGLITYGYKFRPRLLG